MTEKQLQVIIGLVSGMQMTSVHLANVLCHKCGISHEDLATSYEETAALVPENVANRELIQLSLRQVASGIRNVGTGPEWNDLLARLLH